MIPSQYFSNPKYFELVRRGTGLLQEKYRDERIKQIASSNLILAARCKNTCIDDEDKICNFIISLAYSKIVKDGDAASIIALLELGEFMILGDILKEKFQIKVSDSNLIKFILDKEDAYRVLRFFSSKIPVETTKSIFHHIKTNGITVNTEYYNALLNISLSDEVWDIYSEMKQFGLVPNTITFEVLFSKLTEFEKAELLIDEVKGILGIGKTLRSALLKAISLSFNYEIALAHYIELEDIINQNVDVENFEEKSEKQKKHSLKRNRQTLKALPHLIMLSPNQDTAFAHHNKAKEINENTNIFSTFYQYCKKIENEEDLENYIIENIDSFIIKDKKSNNGIRFSNFDIVLNFLIQHKENEKLLFVVLKKMSDCGYKPDPNILVSMLSKYKDDNIIDYCIEMISQSEIDREVVKLSYFTTVISKLEFEKGKIIFEIVKNKGYIINEILYNALIKKAPTYLQGYEIVIEMESGGYTPDKFSFTPLFRKASSIETVFDLIVACSKHNVFPDENFIQILRSIAINNFNEFSNTFINRSKSLFMGLHNKWFETLNTINSEFENIKTFDCEVIGIVPSRVFLKIENEQRKCSIYIGELSHERLNSIYDFEYKGVKLHIGQKILAHLISTDEKYGLNLSTKILNDK
jgi:Pentatricopeptide repeat domain